MAEEPDHVSKPIDESDALVQRPRHGREPVRKRRKKSKQSKQSSQITSVSETENQIQATPAKRLFARIFDLTRL